MFAWTSSLFRDVPMGAIHMHIFEGLKTFILQSPDIVFDVNTLQSEALLGGLGGLIGAYLTTPTDVLTTRIITDESGELEGMNVLSLGRQVIADGGVGAVLWVDAGRSTGRRRSGSSSRAAVLYAVSPQVAWAVRCVRA